MFIYAILVVLGTASPAPNSRQALGEYIGKQCGQHVLPLIERWCRNRFMPPTTTVAPVTIELEDTMRIISLRDFYESVKTCTQFMMAVTDETTNSSEEFLRSMEDLSAVIHRMFNHIYIDSIRAQFRDPNKTLERGLTLLLPIAKTLPQTSTSEWPVKKEQVLNAISVFRKSLIDIE